MPNKNDKEKRKSHRQITATNNFAGAFKVIPNMVVQDQIACIHNDNDNLNLDENNRYISIICPICNMIQTQHRCLFEVVGALSTMVNAYVVKRFVLHVVLVGDVKVDLGDTKCMFENSFKDFM